MQNFDSAARRHYDDAILLESHGRLANADHLAGFATECALKEILVAFLGAQKTPKMPESIDASGKKISHGHLPQLWDQVSQMVTGRSAGTAFAHILQFPNPFGSWSVHDRYDDGDTVASHEVANRIAISRQMIGHLQNAKILGALQ